MHVYINVQMYEVYIYMYMYTCACILVGMSISVVLGICLWNTPEYDFSWLSCTLYQGPGTEYLVPCACRHVLGTKYCADDGSKYLLRCAWYKVIGTATQKYQGLGTKWMVAKGIQYKVYTSSVLLRLFADLTVAKSDHAKVRDRKLTWHGLLCLYIYTYIYACIYKERVMDRKRWIGRDG